MVPHDRCDSWAHQCSRTLQHMHAILRFNGNLSACHSLLQLLTMTAL